MTQRILLCFDLDGVIADSSLAIPAAINAALEAVGLGPLTVEALHEWIGPPLLQSFSQLLTQERHDPGAALDCVAVYRQHYPALAAALTRSYPGVSEMLEELSRMADLVIVTSKPEAFAVPILDGLGLLGRFQAVFAPTLSELEEPKTATLRRALAESGGPRPTTSVMIGDRHHDIEAGRANGLRTIGVLWGFGSRRELVEAGADFLAEEPAQIGRFCTGDIALETHPKAG